jgi:cytochrome c-type biogenesis protein CcmF
MIGELGHFALVLALLVVLLQAALPLLGAQRANAAWMSVARPAAYAQLALVGLAFAVLTYAFVAQDRSFEYVAQNSNCASAVERATFIRA